MISWLSPFSHDTITFYCSKCLANRLSALFTCYGRQNKSSCLIKRHRVLILVITDTYFSNFIDFSGFITFFSNKATSCFSDGVSLAVLVTTLSSPIWEAVLKVCNVFWTAGGAGWPLTDLQLILLDLGFTTIFTFLVRHRAADVFPSCCLARELTRCRPNRWPRAARL